MEENIFETLKDQVEDPSFDVIRCIALIQSHYQNIGICHYLVQKLQSFKYLELEFYIPQFIQLLVSFETDSMALTDFMLEYCRRYPHFCLISFWYLQSYVFELKDSPDSYSFHMVRSFINDIQSIMFNHELQRDTQLLKFRENLHPAIVLSGVFGSLAAVPNVSSYIKPIVTSQSKQQKSFLFRLANFHKALTKNLTLKNRSIVDEASDTLELATLEEKKNSSDTYIKGHVSSLSMSNLDEISNTSDSEFIDKIINVNTKIISKKKSQMLNKRRSEDFTGPRSAKLTDNGIDSPHLLSHSLPDLHSNSTQSLLYDDGSITPIFSDSSTTSLASLEFQEGGKSNPSRNPALHHERVKHLHVNYFKKETEFIMALQNISARLSQVPKEARLTTLRAELSIINNSKLPSEIDIPQLFPVSTKQNKFHRILKLNVNEACVLNSAERVPFLLLIEYLSEEMDFDPQSDHNRNIILQKNGLSHSSNSKRPVSESSLVGTSPVQSSNRNSFEEEDLGDMSVVALSNERNLIASHLSPEASKTKFNGAASPNPTTENSPSLSTKDLSTQMRIATVMLQQLEKSGQASSEQAASIKARIIDSMKSLQDKFETMDYQQISEISSVNVGQPFSDAGERKLENDFKLGEDWSTKKRRIRKSSVYGHLKNWELCSVIAKNGDDLPQEAFACQLISMISKIWKANSVGVWTKNMKILVTSANSGLVETINNAMSIHSIKKSMSEILFTSGENSHGKVASVKDYFVRVYGGETSARYRIAQDNFSRSLAAYSIICYILQIKDRHNGNIMIDTEGHIVHIDFGFLLSNSPGSVGFEAAPFKLTQEYVDVLGGLEGKPYKTFKELCKESFKVLRSNCDQLINMVDLMQKDSSLPCFQNGSQTSILLKQRLQPDLDDAASDAFVEDMLIGKSLGSVYTRLYDQFQLLTQGIYT